MIFGFLEKEDTVQKKEAGYEGGRRKERRVAGGTAVQPTWLVYHKKGVEAQQHNGVVWRWFARRRRGWAQVREESRGDARRKEGRW